MISAFKKMNVEGFSSAWKGNLSCDECSIRLSVFRKKKNCFFCKNLFCQVCIMRREDKKFCCRKCQILTARPLNRNELLNLRSRDLVNYLTSRHISTNGCFEKEDLVNVLMKAVNNSCFHPSSSSQCDSGSFTNSYPSSPRSNSCPTGQPIENGEPSYRVENLCNEDGIRIIGHSSEENDIQLDQFSSGDHLDHTDLQLDSTGRSFNYLEAQDSALPTLSQPNEDISDSRPSQTSEANDSCDNIEESDSVPSRKSLMLSDIKSSAELNTLSVKQLKELLMKNRTDFKGCIERTELIQKANRLWSDYMISRKDLEKLSLDELCKICMDAPIECVLLECGHMATCTSCGKQLCECPICRQYVVRCVRTFKA